MKEKENSAKENFTTIKEWQEAKPFAGKVVGYKGLKFSNFFTGVHKNYQIKNNTDLSFGLMSNMFYQYSSGKGYDISELIKKDTMPSRTALINEHIKKFAGGEVYMRLATREELKDIEQAIKTQQAEFCYDFNHKGLEAIGSQLELESDTF